jgi:hypothetical protein
MTTACSHVSDFNGLEDSDCRRDFSVDREKIYRESDEDTESIVAPRAAKTIV